ncbi:uncharacterized protein LOC121708396 isoform X1 [Alosa sapidissima]|uniref:uncharacterized protein LOC121708396 isoform X1 n=1 Tax=Alosa sapidissima TaxID=34773 RepID=UPI001C081F72|nr:uncharacterized protein LOC121708396 isoform X1 [Alosa sapidissima]XP_041946926.1 uncharacterized protein LOC121708396 isoform X1 [Alosa sapidissima]
MYRLVEFTDTSCLNIIPDDWYDNGITWWPNYKNDQKINNAIQRREKPKSDWSCFAVRELSKAGSYQEARMKLKRAMTCNNTDLQREGDDDGTSKKRRSSDKLLELEDSEEERSKKLRKMTSTAAFPASYVSPSPHFFAMMPEQTPMAAGRTSTVRKGQETSTRDAMHEKTARPSQTSEAACCSWEPSSFRDMLMELAPITAARSILENRDWDSQTSFRGMIQHEQQSVATGSSAWESLTSFREIMHQQGPMATGWSLETSSRELSSDNASTGPTESRHRDWGASTTCRETTPDQPPTGGSELRSSECAAPTACRETEVSSTSMTFRNGRGDQIPCNAAEFHLLNIMESLRQQQMQHAVALNTIINILQGRVNARNAAGDASKDPAEMPQDISYPLMDLRELEKQEVWLENAANTLAKTKMIAYLGAIGGKDLKTTVWKIMSTLIHNNLGKQLNWKGVNDKRAFSSLLLKSVIIRGVRKNPHYTKTTDSEIEKLIIRWLNLAGDRDGGRKQRELAKRGLNMPDHAKGLQPPKPMPPGASSAATDAAAAAARKLPDHLNKAQNRPRTTDPRAPEPTESERLRDQMDPNLNRPENSWTLFQSSAPVLMDPRNVRLNL